MARTTPGIDTRHAASCPVARDPNERCRCTPSYQAHVWSARDKARIRKTFRSLAATKAWRSDTLVALRRGTMRAPTALTLRQAWDASLAGARDGTVRNRSGDAYKPSVLRGYEMSMRLRVLPDLGGARFSEITRVTVQDLADRMLADGRDASTIRTRLCPSARSTAGLLREARWRSTRSQAWSCPPSAAGEIASRHLPRPPR
jgi:hypothetical protein